MTDRSRTPAPQRNDIVVIPFEHPRRTVAVDAVASGPEHGDQYRVTDVSGMSWRVAPVIPNSGSWIAIEQLEEPEAH